MVISNTFRKTFVGIFFLFFLSLFFSKTSFAFWDQNHFYETLCIDVYSLDPCNSPYFNSDCTNTLGFTNCMGIGRNCKSGNFCAPMISGYSNATCENTNDVHLADGTVTTKGPVCPNPPVGYSGFQFFIPSTPTPTPTPPPCVTVYNGFCRHDTDSSGTCHNPGYGVMSYNSPNCPANDGDDYFC